MPLLCIPTKDWRLNSGALCNCPESHWKPLSSTNSTWLPAPRSSTPRRPQREALRPPTWGMPKRLPPWVGVAADAATRLTYSIEPSMTPYSVTPDCALAAPVAAPSTARVISDFLMLSRLLLVLSFRSPGAMPGRGPIRPVCVPPYPIPKGVVWADSVSGADRIAKSNRAPQAGPWRLTKSKLRQNCEGHLPSAIYGRGEKPVPSARVRIPSAYCTLPATAITWPVM
ncbi:hypothetical protein D9M68_760520 [compost metagenome]